MKRYWRIGLILLGILVVAGGLWLIAIKTTQPANVRVGTAELHAKVVVSEADREKGLSGSQPLGDTEAMLFVFPASGQWGIWMKDMNYPIDIAWLDEQKIVRHVVHSAQPSSYPTVFRPGQPTRYVIEMKAGTAKHKRITIGARADIILP